jgi:hypothetical protein
MAAIKGKQIASGSVALDRLAEAVIQADGGQAFTANQSMGGFKLTNLGTPTVSTDAATKGYVDGFSGGGRTFSVLPNPYYVEGTVETTVGAVYLDAGTIATFAALMGSLNASDTATLKLYRQSDSTLISTLTRTNTLGTASTTSVTVASSGWYELRGYNSNTGGTSIFRGVDFDM